MTWADFYLICFIVGCVLSVLSFFLGGFHHDLPGHLSDFGHAHAHLGHAHVDTGHAGHAGHGSAESSQPSPFNLPTMMAFLAWFGGSGFLLTHYYRFWFLLAFGISLLVGFAGALIVFWFLAKVLVAHDHSMDPADYDMVGVLGTVCSTIREGGTGEIVYSQGGTRKTAGARSEEGRAISRGEEVMVTRYEKGIAYVRRWEDAASDGNLDCPETAAKSDEERKA
jgi:membrane protein implicated in regulation of membrane protease activity